jgi:hypothetical protein
MAAYKSQFILGVLGTEFAALKTSDGIYLKDLLEQEIGPSLDLYNQRLQAVAQLLCSRDERASSIANDVLANSSFEEISEYQQPGTRDTVDAWKLPVPIRRFASGSFASKEWIITNSSKKVTELHYSKLKADADNIVRQIFLAALLKTPTARVDALDKLATTPLAFWNDETSMDVPPANGQITFDGDHQHYIINPSTADTLGTAGVTLNTLIGLVEEHYTEQHQVLLWVRTGGTPDLITQAETTYFRAINEPSQLIGAGAPFSNSGLVQALLRTQTAVGGNIKAVGVWKNAVVLATPDMPDHFAMATAYFGPGDSRNPIVQREHPAFIGLKMVNAAGDGNPVVGRDAQYRRYVGFGVRNRSAGAVCYTHSAASWTEPSLTSPSA